MTNQFGNEVHVRLKFFIKEEEEKRMYGWRSKIGILTPTNNTIIEPESASLAPQGVTFHSTRMVSSRKGHGSVEGLKNLVTNVDRAAEELSITGVDAMIYACLSTSFAVENWEDEFTKKV